MAERKDPEGAQAGHDPVESGRHEGRSRDADEREQAPAVESADEGTELIDNHRDSGSAESETTRTDPAPVGDGDAEVLTFPQRPENGDAAGEDSGDGNP